MYQQVKSFAPGVPLYCAPEGMQLVPRVDVVESDEEIIYIFEVPGVEPGRVNIELGDGSIFVDGQPEMQTAGELKFIYRERPPQNRYVRMLSIPPGVDREKVRANIKNGLLTVHFPKKNTGRRLPVKPDEGEKEPEQQKRKSVRQKLNEH